MFLRRERQKSVLVLGAIRGAQESLHVVVLGVNQQGWRARTIA
jgi:hypothetical protein